ncbi:MAG TPA: Ig-like domain-containing protein [Candidatus Binatia bacterium]|nr:Ig-like domain-containing protein [Candidatus Binatia bacterium]
MLTRWLVSLSLGMALIAPARSALAQSQFPPGSYVAGELLIGLKDGVSDDEVENDYKGHGGKKLNKHSQIKAHHIKVPEQALEAIEAKLRKNPKIAYVEKNYIATAEAAPNDPGYSSQWHLSQIAAPGAWDLNAGSSSVVIAVLDSGVDTKHPDLIANLLPGRNFIYNTTNVYDNGSNGGHGTAASGAAAAAGNNATGVSGVSWRSKIMPLVVVQNNYASYSHIAAAIMYAADNGAKVISMSLAGTSNSTTLQNAVNYAWNKGLVLVASAGNNANSTPTFPGSYSNVIAVTATDQSDKPASFTSFGNWVSVAAPGKSIYTTNLGGGYGYWQGTSFSTPLVAGLAGLVFSANPNLTNAQVVNLIESNADDLGTAGFDQYYGHGRINAYRTLQATYASVTPPTVSITSPANGATVSGTVNVTASASSSMGISKVEFYVDGALRSTDTVSPYTFPWNTDGLSGTHTLTAKAYDTLGNQTTSTPKSVTIAPAAVPAPTVSITSPANGATVSGTVNVTASASSSVGITKVEFYVDGALRSTDTSSPYAYAWSTTGLSGSHTLVAKAYDTAGNSTTSSTIGVTIAAAAPPPPPSDTTPPAVTIESVTKSGKSVTVTVAASDSESGVAKVELYVNGELKATDTAAPWTFKISSRSLPKGTTSTLYVKAYDGAGNSSDSANAYTTRRR